VPAATSSPLRSFRSVPAAVAVLLLLLPYALSQVLVAAVATLLLLHNRTTSPVQTTLPSSKVPSHHNFHYSSIFCVIVTYIIMTLVHVF